MNRRKYNIPSASLLVRKRVGRSSGTRQQRAHHHHPPPNTKKKKNSTSSAHGKTFLHQFIQNCVYTLLYRIEREWKEEKIS